MVRIVMMIAIFVAKLVYADGMAKQNHSFFYLLISYIKMFSYIRRLKTIRRRQKL